MRSLNHLIWLQRLVMKVRWLYFVKLWGMDIHPTARFSTSVRFDKTFPKGVHIGPESYVAFDAVILTHDMTRGAYLHTRIGRRCFIGARTIILPGVEVGDECIIGSGAVVTKNIPPRSIAAGVPAKVIQEDISVGAYGRLCCADEPAQKARALEALGRHWRGS